MYTGSHNNTIFGGDGLLFLGRLWTAVSALIFDSSTRSTAVFPFTGGYLIALVASQFDTTHRLLPNLQVWRIFAEGYKAFARGPSSLDGVDHQKQATSRLLLKVHRCPGNKGKMNIPLKLELPVLNLMRFSSRTFARVSVKDDPYSNFALKKKAETIHSILGIACRCIRL